MRCLFGLMNILKMDSQLINNFEMGIFVTVWQSQSIVVWKAKKKAFTFVTLRGTKNLSLLQQKILRLSPQNDKWRRNGNHT